MTEPKRHQFDFTADEREQLEERMRNWGRWSLGSPTGGPGRCGSAEGGYISPREDQERFDKSAQTPVDIRDACKVEDAVVQLSKGRRELLKSWFVYRSHPIELARLYKLKTWNLIPTLWNTLGALQYHLDHTNIRKVALPTTGGVAPSPYPPYIAGTI